MPPQSSPLELPLPNSPHPTSPSPPPSVIVRFLDAFLQEGNIKWLLAVGMMIVLGSSLLLVTPNWQDYAPWGQNLIVLLYALAIHGAGQWTYHRLGLRKTGLVLQGLTVLLIPILFLAFRGDPPGEGLSLETGAMFAATLAFAVLAARRIFDFFLRGRQTTFLASFLLLTVSGSCLKEIIPTDSVLAPFAVGALWATFAAGAIKVSRHIFWLTEEHRAPRIFGFFPIALLGGQFFLLYGLTPALHLSLDWIGLGLVLTAIPILATADAVAHVFQKRTGDLIRPLPWAIVLPMVVGLLLTAAGVVLAATGVSVEILDSGRPMLLGGQSLALAAAAAAGLMAVTARRTGKEAFAWAMCVGILIAYQFSPMFVREAVMHLRSQVEQALTGRQPLPLAYYGVTYLPLLLGLTALSRFTSRPFARPARLFAFGLTCLLWGLSLTNPVAQFVVGLALVAAAALQVRMLGSWQAMAPALAAWFSAAMAAPGFFGHLFQFESTVPLMIAAVSVASLALFVFGRWMDRRIAPMFPGAMKATDLCQKVSLAPGVAMAVAWCGLGLDVSSGLPIAALLAVHAVRWLSPWVSVLAICFAQILAACFIRDLNVAPMEMSLVAIVLVLQWIVGVLLERFVSKEASDGLVRVSSYMAGLWLTLLAGLYILEAAIVCGRGYPVPATWLGPLVIAVWTILAARRSRDVGTTALAYATVMAQAGMVWTTSTHAGLWLPAVWAALAAGSAAANEWSGREGTVRATLRGLSIAVLGVLSALSLLLLNGPMQVAGLISFAGLVIIVERHRTGRFVVPLAVLVNLHLLIGTAWLASRQSGWLVDLVNDPRIMAPLAAAAAGSLVVWQIFSRYSMAQATVVPDSEMPAYVVDQIFRWMLRAVVAIGAVKAFGIAGDDEIVMAAAALGLTAVSEWLAAWRHASEGRVWSGQVLIGLCLAGLMRGGLVTLGHGEAMFVLLGFAFGLHAVRRLAKQPAFDRPLSITSFVLPMVAIAFAVARYAAGVSTDWRGVNSFALLLAAGYYFWRGIERGVNGLHVLALAILNLALALMWCELGWMDPQLFCIPIGLTVLGLVELLRNEIPARFHNPLRYAGALVILVSPVFHMVGGSWIHFFTLMVASVLVILLAIGLRLRALLYTGTAFLVADLVAIVAKAGSENPNLLWLAGVGFGASVIALAAYCEGHRERLLSRMHLLASTLRTWN